METIYLSLRSQEAVGTFLMKSPVVNVITKNKIKKVVIYGEKKLN